MREAVLAHAGEAAAVTAAFRASSKYDQDCIIEFLKSLQICRHRQNLSVLTRAARISNARQESPRNRAFAEGLHLCHL
jgi:hypothetical protein